MNKKHVYFFITPIIYNNHMSKRTFTEQQQNILRTNTNVSSCTSKSITYSKEFKRYVLHAYQEEYRNAREIFESAGFDLEIIGTDIPYQCIARWKRDGIEGRRGRSKKKVFPSLDAELAYVKAENTLLKQLRAQRAEQYSSRKKGIS
jgi:hypothetical protein